MQRKRSGVAPRPAHPRTRGCQAYLRRQYLQSQLAAAVLAAVLRVSAPAPGGRGEDGAEVARATEVVELMRGTGGSWRTRGAVSVAASPSDGAVTVTCTGSAGCGPAGADGVVSVDTPPDGEGTHGLFIENVSLPAVQADLLLQAVGRALARDVPVRRGEVVDSFSLVCPFVGASPEAGGRGDDFRLLVGNCQAPLPPRRESSKLVSTSAFTSTGAPASRYTIGLFFGPASRAGDSFLLQDLRLLRPAAPPPAYHLKRARGPDGLIPPGTEAPVAGLDEVGWAGWGASNHSLLRCPREYRVPGGRAGVDVQRKYDDTIAKLGSESRPLHYYSYYSRTSLAHWDEIVRLHVGGLDYRRGQSVFESGCAAGAFLDSLARQYGVEVNLAGIRACIPKHIRASHPYGRRDRAIQA